ncbi:MAG: hypothetical protein EHM58_11490 [Ignavibacteriae bacterium]|nr:MAG: hypothetical protein EHM58_11490 [Ignavibacteriota bacterium]
MTISKNSNLAIILGSGLDVIVELIPQKTLLYTKTEGIHNKRIYSGVVNHKTVLFFCGRSHFYEGFCNEIILENIKKAKEYGAKYMLITNAAGGLNPHFHEADIMLINSHINLNQQFKNKRTSYCPYNKEFMSLFRDTCKSLKIAFHDGIYGFSHGPAFETKAEIRMLKKMGIDAIGMSTVPEVIEGFSNEIKILGLSVITNILKENQVNPASHEDVIKTASKASEQLFQVINKLIIELN